MNSIEVNLQIAGEAASALHQGVTNSATREILEYCDQLNIRLKPLHPGTEDPILITYFIAQVPDNQAAEQVISELLKLPAVEAAYVKPQDEPPMN